MINKKISDLQIGDKLIRKNKEICEIRNFHFGEKSDENSSHSNILFEFKGFIVPRKYLKNHFQFVDNEILVVDGV